MIRPANTLPSKPSRRRWFKEIPAVRRFVYICTATLSLLSPMCVEAVPLELELEWKPNQEPDLAGYRLHFGTASGEYTEQ